MATDLDRSKPATGAKYESFLEERITRTRHKIRALDVVAAGLGLFSGVLAYGLVMALLDKSLEGLPAVARLVAFGVFTLAALGYVGLVLVMPFFRRVNPYFAARELERTVPGAKNSVINWLDLRDENLPPAIRQAVGRRAAKDLAKADVDRAVSKRRVVWMGAVAGSLFLAVVMLFLFAPGQFWSLMGRAFAPFLDGSLASQTQITIVQPEGGNTTVAVNHPVTIAVRVTGRTPPAATWRGPIALDVQTDAAGRIRGYRNVPADVDPNVLMLHMRYSRQDPYTQLALEHDVDNEWKVTVPAGRVLNGFSYRVTGNDAQTREYQVKVTSTPLVTKFDVTYDYPDWVRRRQSTSDDPNLKAVRDTQVSLVVHTNRPLKEGYLDTEIGGDKKTLEGKILPGDPEAVAFRFPLTQSGGYRVRFTSTTGERYEEPIRYTIDALASSVVTFEYRKYLGHAEQTFTVTHLPNLTALRGTKARIDYRASQAVDGGQLDVLVGKKRTTLKARTDARSPEVLHFPDLVIDQDGSYQLRYTDRKGKEFVDPVVYPIKALPDSPPRVELTQPGKDVSLPANGVLKLEGSANDDFGLTNLTLRLWVSHDNTTTKLEPKVYRDGQVLKTGKGRYPLHLDYKDFVELAKVRPAERTPFTLKPGMVIDYWLEATDNCDYPDPKGQVGESKHYKVTILPPEDKQKQQQQKDQAKQEQQKHEQKQDEKLKNQQDQPKPPSETPKNQPDNKQEQNQQNKPEKGNQGQDKKPDQENPNEKKKPEDANQGNKKKPDKGNPDKKTKPNEGNQGNEKEPEKGNQGNEKKPNQGNQGNNKKPEKGNQGNNAANKEQQKERSDLEKTGNKLKDELNKSEKGKGKPDEKQQPRPQSSENKGQGPKQQKDDKNRSKSEGPKQEKKGNQQCDSKGAGKEGTPKENQGQAKKGGPEGKNGAPEAKGQPKGRGNQAEQPQDKGNEPNKANPEKKPDGGNERKPNTKEGNEQPNQPNKAKGGGQPDDKHKTGDAKSGGQPEKKKPDGSRANPKPKPDHRSDSKSGGRKEAANPAEPKKKGNESKANDSKSGAGQQGKKQPRQGKNAGGNEDRGEKRERANLDDVKKLSKDLQNKKDPRKQDQAQEELSRIAEQAKDPQVRKAAEDALKKQGRGKTPKNNTNTGENGPKKEGPKKEGPKGNNPNNPPEKDPMKGQKGKGQGPPQKSGKKEDPNSKQRGKGVDGNNEAGNQGDEDPEHKGKAADPNAARKAADLSLESLRDKLRKMSPEERRKLLKKANISEKDYQAWDKKVQNYEKKWIKKEKIADPKKGSRGNLRNDGPRKVEGSGKNGAIESGRGAPPPEYKDLFERYTRRKVSD